MALRAAASYNRDDQVAPAAVLWTDGERLWEPLLPRLRDDLPLLTLGPFDPAVASGPAYWVRAQLRASDEPRETPIVYLPGVRRADLRAVEEAPRSLQPLAELQYRGVFWAHRNGRDWTPAAFMQSDEGGLDIEVGSDAASRDALQRTLLRLVDTPLDELRRDAPLRAAYFDALLNPDEVRSLLSWMDAPQTFCEAADANQWVAFRSLCRSRYGFDPESDGPVTAGHLLGTREGPWEVVWNRFREGVRGYRSIPDLLRRGRDVSSLDLFSPRDAWPQDNEEQESSLRDDLTALGNATRSQAVETIAALEETHGGRRTWVWSDLGRSPLAHALGHLATLAAETEQPVTGPTVAEIGAVYTGKGWRADRAFRDALAAVEGRADVDAVKAAANALYEPWLDAGSRALQDALRRESPPIEPPIQAESGACILFCDGLRYDLACELAHSVTARGRQADIAWRFAALPTVTPTAKPAIAPVRDTLAAGQDLDAAVRESGRRVTVEVLRRLLEDAGYQILRGQDTGDPSGKAWAEAGAIDARGHETGTAMVHQIPAQRREIAARIDGLLAAGWRQVTVITDHGWLLGPRPLPKATLPETLTMIRKGRCARLKPGAATDQQTVPWFWDPAVQIAVAPGITCFEAGKEYEHGGVSPQECIVPVIGVRAAPLPGTVITIEGVRWKGLRCGITVRGATRGEMVDIRTRPADPASSIVLAVKSPGPDGTVSLVVPDDANEGAMAMVVVSGEDGEILGQQTVQVGS